MFKDTYKTALSAYETFWERTNKGRPILNFSYRKDGFTWYRDPVDVKEQFFSAEYRYHQFKHTVAGTGYLAEGVPMFFTNFGPGCLAACIGGSFTLAPHTVWFDRLQLIEDWENPPKIGLDEQCEMWQRISETQTFFSRDADVHFSVTDIGGIMDVVASLRGTENLLYDLYDYPEEVKQFAAKVKIEWLRMFDQQIQLVKDAGQPYNAWMNIPSSKPWYPLQCDFCYMISPAQFEEFVLSDIIDQVNYMDRSVYHLDGPGELPHVDMLLDIPGLTGIQWIAGPGEAPLTDPKWYPLYQKIQDKKKNIILLDAFDERDVARAERLIKSIDPTGVYISANFSSRQKAEDFLEKITRWSQ